MPKPDLRESLTVEQRQAVAALAGEVVTALRELIAEMTNGETS